MTSDTGRGLAAASSGAGSAACGAAVVFAPSARLRMRSLLAEMPAVGRALVPEARGIAREDPVCRRRFAPPIRFMMLYHCARC
jgi:hypothetical protein